MGVTESDVFEAVELIESSGVTQLITRDQKSDLSKALWDARDEANASQPKIVRPPLEQIEDFFGLAGPNRDVYEGIPFSTRRDRTSVSSATDQTSSSALSSAWHRDSFSRLTRNWSTKATIPFRSQKTKDRV